MSTTRLEAFSDGVLAIIITIVDLYLRGRLELDERISRRYRLDQINEAFQALDGTETRGIVAFG